MPFIPRDEDSIYESLRDRLVDRISGLTNFVSGSFNDVWTSAFSQGLRENELQASASQLSGWIEYSGGPITQSDLDDLEMDDVDPEELNQYMDDQDLDELVQIVGIDRDGGTQSAGEVTFTTVSSTTEIPEGTQVGTQPDASGSFLRFETDQRVETDSGETEVDVTITAEEVGSEYNIGADTITYLPAPPTGVQAVTNNEATSGGVDRETNSELRERAKQAVFATSGGGTANGIIGYIQQNTDARDVIIEEFTDVQPPYVDVTVDGGDDTEVQDAIDFSKPVGIEHNFIRPTSYTISIEADVLGNDIDTTRIENDLTDFVNGLGISDDFYRDKVFQIIFNSDEDVINTERLDTFIINEIHEYSTGTDVYALDKGDEMEQETGVTEVTGTFSGNNWTFTEGSDFEEVDDSGDGSLDSVNFDLPLLSGAVADDGGATTDETTEANDGTTDDMTLLPSSPATGDAYYFGGPNAFDGLDLNISTAGDGDWTLVWEYWDGSSWASLTNVSDGTNGFTTAGTNTIIFDEPTDWATTDVGGITDEYWIRARVDTFTSITTQPLGQEAHLGREPDDATEFFVDYEIEEDITFGSREKAAPGTMIVTVV